MGDEQFVKAIDGLWSIGNYIQEQARLTSGQYPNALYSKEQIVKMEELLKELGSVIVEPANN